MKNPTDNPIHDALGARWSPYGFDDQKPVDTADLVSVFEAARWAMSSYNEQPWRYIVANKSSDSALWDQILSVLLKPNQAWARFAPVLAVGLVRHDFAESGKPNKSAEHDLGAASACLTFEATTRGLAVHQMAGIDPEKVVEAFSIPADMVPMTALAIGFPGRSADLSDEIAERDSAKRHRKPLEEIILHGRL